MESVNTRSLSQHKYLLYVLLISEFYLQFNTCSIKLNNQVNRFFFSISLNLGLYKTPSSAYYHLSNTVITRSPVFFAVCKNIQNKKCFLNTKFNKFI